MKLKFKHQQFQIDAARAVTEVFQGQPNQAMVEFTHDTGRSTNGQTDMDIEVLGFRNQPLHVDAHELQRHINALQQEAQLKPSGPVKMNDLRLTIVHTHRCGVRTKSCTGLVRNVCLFSGIIRTCINTGCSNDGT